MMLPCASTGRLRVFFREMPHRLLLAPFLIYAAKRRRHATIFAARLSKNERCRQEYQKRRAAARSCLEKLKHARPIWPK